MSEEYVSQFCKYILSPNEDVPMVNQHWLKRILIFPMGLLGFGILLAIFDCVEAELLSHSSGSYFSVEKGKKERGRECCLDVCFLFYFGKNSYSLVSKQNRFMQL